MGANFRRLIVCNAMLAKLSVAFNQKLLGNSDLVSNTVAEEDVYICPAGEKLATNKENGMLL